MITQHEDKSEQWLEWRKKGIGSSDAAAVIGVSPYATTYQLWEDKTGKKIKEAKGNWAMNRGNELEPVARAKYELLTGLEMKARLFEHYQYPFLRASFDGYNEQAKKGIEIKFQGREAHESGAVPEKYYPQIQHQILCSGCESIDFISYNPDCTPDFVVINVLPDLEWIKTYSEKAIKFWNENVIGDEPPEISDKDTKILKDDAGLSKKYKDLKEAIKKYESEVEKIEKEILETTGATDHPRIQFGSIKITKFYTKGKINYKSIPELKKIDLEKYRGKPTFSVRIS